MVETMNETSRFLASFEVIYHRLLQDLQTYRLPANGVDWFQQMFRTNVVGGKMNRGLTVASAFAAIRGKEVSSDELFDCDVLGWCIEMLQAFFLIQDDIMDESITRRGKPCWYRNHHVGMVAINDSIMIEMALYKLLKIYFASHPAYPHLVDLFHETTYQTEMGQLMDLITAPEGDVDLARFSNEKYPSAI